jgi:hypothetical protein
VFGPQAIESATNCNPSYLELGRGVGGWLSVTYEPYGLCLNWTLPSPTNNLKLKPAEEEDSCASPRRETGASGKGGLGVGEGGGSGAGGEGGGGGNLLPCWAGMAIDSRDWGIANSEKCAL